MFVIGVVDRCSCGSELWIGAAVDRSCDGTCGSVLVIGAVDQSCDRSYRSVLVTEMMWIGACDREGER